MLNPSSKIQADLWNNIVQDSSESYPPNLVNENGSWNIVAICVDGHIEECKDKIEEYGKIIKNYGAYSFKVTIEKGDIVSLAADDSIREIVYVPGSIPPKPSNVTLILECESDADCVVKQTGCNCCGYTYGCVNKESPEGECNREYFICDCINPKPNCTCVDNICQSTERYETI